MVFFATMQVVLANITLPGCIDAVVVTLLVVFGIAGTVRGLAGECARLLALGAGVAVAFLLYPLLRTHLFVHPELPWKILTLAGTVLGSSAAGLLVHSVTRRFLRIIIGQPADAILGGIIALITTSIAIVVVLFFVHAIPLSGMHNAVFKQSASGRISEPLIVFAKEMTTRK